MSIRNKIVHLATAATDAAAHKLHEAEQLVVLPGSAHIALASAIARELGVELCSRRTKVFPDGEIEARVGDLVAGRDVVLVQPTAAPCGERLLELLLMSDACKRGGARTLVGVVPYVGYARQDHTSGVGEALGIRVVADMLERSFDRLIVVDLHAGALEGCFGPIVHHVSAVPLLAEAVRRRRSPESIVVAPDMGAAKVAQKLAMALELPVALVQKVRRSGREVTTHGVMGEVKGKSPILIDDMISTGATIVAAIAALRAQGCDGEITVVATHGVFVADALHRLAEAGVAEVIVSDSLPGPENPPLRCTVVPVAALLAAAVRQATAPGAM